LRVTASGVFLLAAASVATTLIVRGEPNTPVDLVVHEWGTFLCVQGSDGMTLDGMYHEEHALPGFVHSRRRDQLRLPTMQLKGETPVIYFYTPRPLKVDVSVEFPTGIWTQWYPQANIVRPGLATASAPATIGEPRNGYIRWIAELIPNSGNGPEPALPKAPSDALWNFSRDVESALVRTIDHSVKPTRPEYERFLFYRGLGRGELSLEINSANGGELTWTGDGSAPVRHVFVLQVQNGQGAFNYLPSVAPGERRANIFPTSNLMPLERFADALADELADRLVESGLYPQEARAMVNTWRQSYFQTDGVRVLFILPQEWTDRFIPLTVSPTPRETVRVMVGRIEVLTPERESQAEQAVRELVAPDPAVRMRAFDYLRNQGRFVEPVIRRVIAATSDEQLRARCRRLLMTDIVTELRAANQSPTDGARIIEDPVDVRAQLACLLRQIGLESEAKVEAEAALKELRQRPAPPMDRHDARQYLRAYARASEALGDDVAAAEWYGRFIRFASQVATSEACQVCHDGKEAPHDITWFDDWWAGRRFAACNARLGRTAQAIADCQAALAHSSNDAALRMELAFLRKAAERQIAGKP
jgi:hypothetical protein